MAEGGFQPEEGWLEFVKKNPDYFKNQDEEEENVTYPFTPGEASTPCHRGEEWEMQTMHQEQTGLPSYEETSFGGDDERVPLVLTDEYIQNRLEQLRRNSNTGILDLSGITAPDPKENPLSSEDQNEQKERARRFIKSRYPNANLKNLVIGFSKKKIPSS